MNEYIEEQLSDVKTNWHPKKGLFTSDDPKEIVDYLMKNSKDQAQAMQRLCFYMNRAGNKLTNKIVLNKAKQMLKKEKVEEKLVIDKNYRQPYNKNKCLYIYSIIWASNCDNLDQVVIAAADTCVVEDDKILMNPESETGAILKRVDDYYYWENETEALNLYIIGLNDYDGVMFLSSLLENVPKQINVHDYFNASPNKKCEFVYFDDNTKKYLNYTKKDIQKIIDDLNK